MFLSILIVIPVVTSLIILFCKEMRQARNASFTGAAVQLVAALFLLYQYSRQSSSGSPPLSFQDSYNWFRPFHINFQVGVDGISIAMILLTAVVVFAGIAVSWTVERLGKEFFFLLTL